MTMLPELTCIDCGLDHPPEAWRCTCGGALDEAMSPDLPTKADLEPRPHDGARGVWRHADLLGLPASLGVSLGEGDTPLAWDPVLNTYLKLEGSNPTGSFKDRGATVTASVAKALGAEAVVEDSSGNAGSAIAAYAAAADLACTIMSPASLTDGKRRQMETLGATVNVVDGPRKGVTDAAVRHARDTGAYYASHTYTPHFLRGCTTLAYELVRDLGDVPDVIITPCAMGSVLLGLHRGFTGLIEADLIEAAPRLIAVQATGHHPLVTELEGEVLGDDNPHADGLLIPRPPRLQQLITAVRDTDGLALAVGAHETTAATMRLHKRGHLVEPSSAVTHAALTHLRGTGDLHADEVPVLIMTGRWKPS